MGIDRDCPWMTAANRCVGHAGGRAGEDQSRISVAAMVLSSAGGRSPSSVTTSLVGKRSQGGGSPRVQPLPGGHHPGNGLIYRCGRPSPAGCCLRQASPFREVMVMATTPSTTEGRSGTVRANGVRLYYEELGQGPAILVGENDRGSGLAATVPAWAMGEARPGRHDPRWQVAGGARQKEHRRPRRPMPCWLT